LQTSASTPLPAASARTIHLLLALANMAVGIAAFMVIGILSPISATFGIEPWQAGWLMTIYAIVYAVSSPILVALTGRIDRRTVLSIGLTLLATASLLSAIAPSFPLMLASRALMALGAGLITPVATAIAVATVEPDHRGRALATVFGGFTIAQALGVPAGVWLGYQFGWRLTFGIVAALAFLCLLVLRRYVPQQLKVQPSSLAILAGVLREPVLVLAVLFISCLMASAFTVYTYLAPFLQTKHGFAQTGVTIVFLIFGIGGIVGNALGGFLTDRIGPQRALVALTVAMMVVLAPMTLLSFPALGVGAAVAVWSVIGWSVNVPQQARLAGLDPSRTPILLALHASCIYLGTSLGAIIGGTTIALAGHELLGPVAILPAGLGLLSLVLTHRLRRRQATAAR
jgi:predicted MFS family arabinose efflux permease